LAKLKVGESFPAGTLRDMDGATVGFPAAFGAAPATVVFFYRGRW
jgi:peroxiredoxin